MSEQKTGWMGTANSLSLELAHHEGYRLHTETTMRRNLYEKIGELWVGDERPTVIYHGTVKEEPGQYGVHLQLSVVIALLDKGQVAIGEHLDGSKVPSWITSSVFHDFDGDLIEAWFERETFTPGVKPVVVWKRTA